MRMIHARTMKGRTAPPNLGSSYDAGARRARRSVERADGAGGQPRSACGGGGGVTHLQSDDDEDGEHAKHAAAELLDETLSLFGSVLLTGLGLIYEISADFT